VRATAVSPAEARRRMRSMRRRVREHDVAHWAQTFLSTLDGPTVGTDPGAAPGPDADTGPDATAY